MPTPPIEAAARIAAFTTARKISDTPYGDVLYTLAADVAAEAYPNPDEALVKAHDIISRKTNEDFEGWLVSAEGEDEVNRRIAMHENFASYQGAARRLASPLVRKLVLATGQVHEGSGAYAYDTRSPEGERVLLKAHRRLLEPSSGRLQTPAGRLRFAEQRIWTLPEVPKANFEQLRAATYAGMIVTSKIAGTALQRVGRLQLERVTDDQLHQAVVDLDAMATAGVMHDASGKNTNLDRTRGFGFFDPSKRSTDPAAREEYLAQNLIGFAEDIAGVGPSWLPSAPHREQRQELLGRLQDVARGVSPEAGDIVAAAADDINAKLARRK